MIKADFLMLLVSLESLVLVRVVSCYFGFMILATCSGRWLNKLFLIALT